MTKHRNSSNRAEKSQVLPCSPAEGGEVGGLSPAPLPPCGRVEGRGVLVSLVGGQSMPNILAALQYAPAEAVFLTTSASRYAYEDTKAVLENRGIRCRPVKVSAYDMEEIERACRTIAQEYRGKALVFNITGGTKPMSIGAFLVAIQEGSRVIYVDTHQEQILHLHPRAPSERMTGVIDVPTYLRAYGKEVTAAETEQDVDPEEVVLANWIGKEIAAMSRVLGKIRKWYGLGARGVVQIPYRGYKRAIAPILQRLDESGYVTDLRDMGVHASFRPSLDSGKRFFLCGGWLELYVFAMASLCEFDDCRLGVHIRWNPKEDVAVSNELDVVMVRNHRLVICSCKTARQGSDTAHFFATHLSELETLKRHCGGPFASVLLITSSTIRRNRGVARRAEELGIPIINPQRLPELKTMLERLEFAPGI